MIHRQCLSLVLVLALVAGGCGRDESGATPAQQAGASKTATPAGSVFSDSAKAAAEQINQADLRTWIAHLADDALGGRGPGSDGDQQARAYLAGQLEALGYAPGAADGGWQQPFELVGITAAQPDAWTFRAAEESLTLDQWEEFIIASGVQQAAAAVEDAEVVFVGYGIDAPEYAWNDFKGRDLSGKVLLMLNNDPDWDPELFAGDTRLYYGRWTYKYESAARQGAAGAIIIHTTPSAGYPWQVVQTSWTGEQFQLPAGSEPRNQFESWVTEDAARRLVALGGQELSALVESARSRDFQPVPLGVRTSIELKNQISRSESANVLGILRGGDAELADEAIVVTAHHDHLGIGTPNDAGDTIYNGARDNAAGVGMALGVAKAIAALPERPRRSILIALVGAEEQGLLGSKYFGQHPPIPAGKLAANINFDAPNIWGPTEDITYIGMGKSTLDQVARRVAEYQKRDVHPDESPDKGFFYRSDQFSLARVGVPALYLDGGNRFTGRPPGWGKEQMDAYTAKHYHQPSDEISDQWNYAGMIQDARFGFWAALIIAAGDEMPEWNPGDEFEAARKAALAAAP